MEHNPLPAGTQATTPPLASGIARFLNKPGSPEFEQAFIRFVFASGIVVYFAFQTFHLAGQKGGGTETEQALAIGLVVFWLIAIAILAAIFVWPAKSVTRRVVGMLSDVGVATFYVWLAGENGAFMIAVYLFLIFGNGFRFGPSYLHTCQALSLAGLGAAGIFVPYWQQHSTEWLAFLFTLSVIPFYVGVLLARVNQARARSKAALEECLARQEAIQ